MNRYRIRTLVVLEELHAAPGSSKVEGGAITGLEYLPRFTRSSTTELETLDLSETNAAEVGVKVAHDLARIRSDINRASAQEVKT